MKKGLVIFIALGLLGAGGWYGWNWYQKKNESPPYREVKVERGNLEVTVLATGVVQPENRLELKPPIAGRVESILVEEGRMVDKGQVLAWLSSSERAALLDAARAKGSGEVAHWEDLFKPTPLLAPLNGLIIVKNVVPGQVVAATDVVLVMSDHLIVNTQVDETDIGKVRLGEQVTISLDAYPDTKIEGNVIRIGFESKTVNNVTIYEVRVKPTSVPEFMRSGMTANVTFFTGGKENILLIPAEAIRQENGKPTVLLPNPTGPDRPITREIQTGMSEGKNTEVVTGLVEGETILVPTVAKGKGKSTAGTNPFAPFGGGRPRGR